MLWKPSIMRNNNIYMSNVHPSTGCTADPHYNQQKKGFSPHFTHHCVWSTFTLFFGLNLSLIFSTTFNILRVCVRGKASCSCPFPEATRSCFPQAAGLNSRSSSAHLCRTPQQSRRCEPQQTPHLWQQPNSTSFNSTFPTACGNTPRIRHFWVGVKHARDTFHSLGFFKPD